MIYFYGQNRNMTAYDWNIDGFAWIINRTDFWNKDAVDLQ